MMLSYCLVNETTLLLDFHPTRQKQPRMSVYERPLSPPRGGGGWDPVDGFGRESYGRAPSPGLGAGAGVGVRRDDYPPPVALDDPYAVPRRPRSPEEGQWYSKNFGRAAGRLINYYIHKDRRKRRRSPSPLGPRGDTYIPSYHRDRSPPYRERREYYGGGSAGGGGGGGGWGQGEPLLQGLQEIRQS